MNISSGYGGGSWLSRLKLVDLFKVIFRNSVFVLVLGRVIKVVGRVLVFSIIFMLV